VSRNRVLSDSNWQDDNGHGTHVGGTAAARDNGEGVVGVAPGARLTAVKVLDASGKGSLSAIIAGINWVAARADRFAVANMSLGGGYSQAENDAVKGAVAKGIVFVVAAGNDAADAGLFSPASEPSAITVSALADRDGLPGGTGGVTSAGGDDTFATFSNYGVVVDLCAPGVDILSTYLGGSYAIGSGTSMASPHVAGAAALYVARKGLEKTAAGVAAVATALKAAGWRAGDAAYLLDGDPDNVPEPLLNVAALFNAAPVVEISSPTDPFTFASGAAISFAGTASDAEDGDRTADLKWTLNRVEEIGSGGSFSTTLVDGVHTITATATDSAGAVGSASVTITVGTPNLPPEVTITAPGDGATFNSGEWITFIGSALDAEDGDQTASLVWTSNLVTTEPIGTGRTFSTDGLPIGQHIITASVEDYGGLTGSASITVTVRDGSLLVVPGEFETVEANGYSGTIKSAIRLQEVYSATHFDGPVTIKGMAFRLDNSSTATAGKISIRVRLSTTQAQPDNLSQVFSSNIGPNETEVFPQAEVTVSAATGAWPNGFDINIPFPKSFVFDPAAGNLLVDIITYSGVAGLMVDAANVPTDGASRAYSTNIKSTKAAVRDSGADVIQFKLEPSL
jgi:hypothetical protein